MTFYLFITESYSDNSSSDDEDSPSAEIDHKKLVLDMTMHKQAFQTDESLRQNLDNFVEAVVTDMNGQEFKNDNSVLAVLQLHESEIGLSESKEVIEDKTIALVRQIADTKGPIAVAKYIQENLNKWKVEKVSFGVLGRHATGKSTFINTIRDVKPGNPGFAEFGGGNTTNEATEYTNPQNERVAFYDLPGVGTLEFQKMTNASNEKFMQCDYFFLLFDKVVSEDDYFLICKLVEFKKSFCLVRSKIDKDLRNAKYDKREAVKVIPDIRKQIHKQILQYEHLKNSEAIFLISCTKTEIGDWQQLLCHIEKCLPLRKLESFIYSLPSLTENVIDFKYRTLRQRLKVVSIGVAVIAAVPVPELDVVANIAILVEEVLHYMKVFGIDKSSINALQGFDRSKLKCAGFLVSGVDLFKEIKIQLGKYAALSAVGSDAELFFPNIGFFAGTSAVGSDAELFFPNIGFFTGKSAVFTYRYLNRILDNLRDDARIVYRCVLEQQNV
ncbi:Hypothetical predicted protein [Mytilus galloprovincialis]|uniref:IRG-type G domain-containing protein n=1 Tax=Mytilus galloprovincialis TaxID=29158 RepID=A0A8B6DHQ6_MYTGA|nr:Hypothetical predicted protein [Mytilus galloprovincialis]